MHRTGFWTGLVVGLAALAVTLLPTPVAGATPISQTFDSNSLGWQADQGGIAATPFDPFDATAGNPGGGGLRITDTGDDACEDETDPCAFAYFFSGALPTSASNYGGTLSFDFRSSAALPFQEVFACITDSPDALRELCGFATYPSGSTAYQKLTLPLVSTSPVWDYCDYNPPFACGSPTAAQMTALLSGPTELIVSADQVEGIGEAYSLDNVAFTDGGPVVTPPTVASATKPKKGKKGGKKKCGKKKGGKKGGK